MYSLGKKYIASILLSVFAFTVVPKILWHYCESEHVIHTKDTTGKHFDTPRCPDCNFQLIHFLPGENNLFFIQDILLNAHENDVLISAYYNLLLKPDSRGPPCSA